MTTEERLEKLEAELAERKAGLAAAKRLTRRLMTGAGVVLGMCALFVAVRAMTGIVHSQAGVDVAKVIRANKFEVVDEKGTTRAILCIAKDWPSLVLFDEKGTTLRAGLEVSKDGPNLFLFNEKFASAGLGVFKDGPILFLCDENNITRAMLTLIESWPSLSLNDEKGEKRAVLDVSKDGPNLFLFDEKGRGRAKLGVSKTTTPDGKPSPVPAPTEQSKQVIPWG